MENEDTCSEITDLEYTKKQFQYCYEKSNGLRKENQILIGVIREQTKALRLLTHDCPTCWCEDGIHSQGCVYYAAIKLGESTLEIMEESK